MSTENLNCDKIYDRTKLVLGDNAISKLKNTRVCICGVGGVGSFVFEALVRMGIGNITIIDKDSIDITNINRQIIATSKNVGSVKVIEAKKRANEINPRIRIIEVMAKLTPENVEEYITENMDCVIDAIDNVEAKIAIIKRCKQLNIKVISSMGMANKIEPLKIKVADISKTDTCPLARVIRKRLKEENIKDVKVVYSTEESIKVDGTILGSVSYVPSVAGLIVASEVVKDILYN